MPTRDRRTRPLTVLLLVLAASMAVGAGFAAAQASALTLDPTGGPEPDAVLGAPAVDEGLAFAVTVDEPQALDGAVVTLDGEDVTPAATVEGATLRYAPSDLADGPHEVAVRVDRGFPFADAVHRWSFAIDTQPPELEVTEPTGEVPYGEPVALAGTTDPDADVRVGDDMVAVAEDGGFRVELPEPPEAPLRIAARDPLGNAAEVEHTVDVATPEPRVDQVRAVHVTAYAWATPSLRDPILRMIDEGRINSVEIDIKDEAGLVGYASEVPLARESGAVEEIFDLAEVVETLHERDVHVIGRIVAFRDSNLADWAWGSGRTDWLVNTPDGGRYGQYGGGFMNFAHPEVRQYNLDLAAEAAAAGVDDVLWDYIRRPDGPLEAMVFPGLEGEPEDSITSFVDDSRQVLYANGAIVGVSVFGIAADRPHEIAQDIPDLSQVADYIAPMIYPSHWGPGEYDVANPDAQPYDITLASLQEFAEVMAGSEARLVPWLQDFSLGVTYGPAEVRAQIDAARDAGTEEWILWDPAVTYTDEALDPR